MLLPPLCFMESLLLPSLPPALLRPMELAAAAAAAAATAAAASAAAAAPAAAAAVAVIAQGIPLLPLRRRKRSPLPMCGGDDAPRRRCGLGEARESASAASPLSHSLLQTDSQLCVALVLSPLLRGRLGPLMA